MEWGYYFFSKTRIHFAIWFSSNSEASTSEFEENRNQLLTGGVLTHVLDNEYRVNDIVLRNRLVLRNTRL